MVPNGLGTHPAWTPWASPFSGSQHHWPSIMNLNSYRPGFNCKASPHVPSGCLRIGSFVGSQWLNDPARKTLLAMGARQPKMVGWCSRRWCASNMAIPLTRLECRSGGIGLVSKTAKAVPARILHRHLGKSRVLKSARAEPVGMLCDFAQRPLPRLRHERSHTANRDANNRRAS